MPDVVTVAISHVRAPGETAPAVPVLQSTPNSVRDDARRAPEADRLAVIALCQLQLRTITGNPLRRFRGNVGAVFDVRSRHGSCFGLATHVENDLVAIRGRTIVITVVEEGLGHVGERVGAAGRG